jgi:hypothetical protein
MNLKPGEYICDECDGSGVDAKYENYLYEYRDYYKCPKCHGEGKLDWVEKVVGKKGENPMMHVHGVMMPPSACGPPPEPLKGQTYINSNSQEIYTYDGSVWAQVVSNTTPI